MYILPRRWQKVKESPKRKSSPGPGGCFVWGSKHLWTWKACHSIFLSSKHFDCIATSENFSQKQDWVPVSKPCCLKIHQKDSPRDFGINSITSLMKVYHVPHLRSSFGKWDAHGYLKICSPIFQQTVPINSHQAFTKGETPAPLQGPLRGHQLCPAMQSYAQRVFPGSWVLSRFNTSSLAWADSSSHCRFSSSGGVPRWFLGRRRFLEWDAHSLP